MGAAITLVFTAANVYLGLKVGLTFASSIPAAVISMAVLRAFRNATIYENNIVQTIASAAGTLSSIIFVLAGTRDDRLVERLSVRAIVCDLRDRRRARRDVQRAVAARAGDRTPIFRIPKASPPPKCSRSASAPRSAAEHNRAGLLALVAGTLASAAFAVDRRDADLCQRSSRHFFASAAATTGVGFSLSLALVGAGQLIGLTVGIAIFAGLFIAWGIATPILTALHPAAGAAADVATAVWAHQVRFIGAGAIGVAAFGRSGGSRVRSRWASLRRSQRRAAAQGAGAELPRTERDLPIGIVGCGQPRLL